MALFISHFLHLQIQHSEYASLLNIDIEFDPRMTRISSCPAFSDNGLCIYEANQIKKVIIQSQHET